MGDCCSPNGYRWVFSERSARKEAKRYLRRGLDGTSREIADFLTGQGVEGRTLLEVGGGIGALQIELVKAGAASALSVELTPTYEGVAHELLRGAGIEGRIDRQVMDFVEASAAVPETDIVVMNRVICCYPDMPSLAGAAADHARQFLVLSFPNGAWWIRIGLSLGNLALRIARREFQIFVHPPQQIASVLEAHGLKKVQSRSGLVWTVAVFRRAR